MQPYGFPRAERSNGSKLRSSYPTAIAVDPSGDVVVTGTSVVGYGATTIKYAAADGRVLWQHIDPAPINFQVIAVDRAGDVIRGGRGRGIHDHQTRRQQQECRSGSGLSPLPSIFQSDYVT
jgi:hypothetical protein